MTREEFEKVVKHRTVVEWKDNMIKLDNGVIITIEMTDYDCCAFASGDFEEVELDAAITDVVWGDVENVSDIYDGYENQVEIVLLHNRNAVAKANARANGGNGGYYHSVASFVVTDLNEQESILPIVSA